MIWTSQIQQRAQGRSSVDCWALQGKVDAEGHRDSLKKGGQGEYWAESQPCLLRLLMFANILVFDPWVVCLYSLPS